jgi:hypothetical protein
MAVMNMDCFHMLFTFSKDKPSPMANMRNNIPISEKTNTDSLSVINFKHDGPSKTPAIIYPITGL